jgi:hypothetical protein
MDVPKFVDVPMPTHRSRPGLHMQEPDRPGLTLKRRGHAKPTLPAVSDGCSSVHEVIPGVRRHTLPVSLAACRSSLYHPVSHDRCAGRLHPPVFRGRMTTIKGVRCGVSTACQAVLPPSNRFEWATIMGEFSGPQPKRRLGHSGIVHRGTGIVYESRRMSLDRKEAP